MICDECLSIGVDADGENGLMTENFERVIKGSNFALAASAVGGCECCAIILQSLEPGIHEDVDGSMPVTLRWWRHYQIVKRPYLEDIWANYGNYVVGTRQEISFREFQHKGGSPRLGISTSKDNPAAADPRLIGRTVDRSIEGSINWLRSQMEDCLTGHVTCPKALVGQLPTRVLDLQHSNDELLLVDGQGCTGLYIALSHCWGPPTSQPLKTTTASLKNSRKISIADLTAVFQQAVTVTKMLGVRYLWIDALCIIQDSKRDWELESVRMSAVYRNALLTIASSCSPDSHTGFLPPSPSAPAKTCVLPFYSKFTAKPGAIYLKELGEDLMVRAVADNAYEPLQRRAWTLQERILSPRIVFFDSRELLWECSRGTILQSRNCVVEDVWTNHAMYLPSNVDLTRERMSLQVMRKVLVTQKVANVNLYDLWIDLLSVYATRTTTYIDDALVAISGIAQQLRLVMGDTYLAGVWQGDFQRGLLWHFDSANHGSWGEDPAFTPRKRSEVAPSWSWASYIFQPHVVQFYATATRDLELVEDTHAAQLKGCEVTPDGSMSYVQSAKLCLSGFLHPVQLVSGKNWHGFIDSFALDLGINDGPSTSCEMDDILRLLELSGDDSGKIWSTHFECLLVGQWAYDRPSTGLEPMWHCLVLRDLENGIYERVGYAMLKPPFDRSRWEPDAAWFDRQILDNPNPGFGYSHDYRQKTFDSMWKTWTKKTITII